MGTTTTLDLPYPEGTDLVIEGDDAIQALAEAVEARLVYNASVTIAPGESALAVSGATPVDFPGTQNVGGFTVTDNKQFTYTGTGDRFFIVCASVEVEVVPAAATTTINSTVHVLHNGSIVQASFDEIASFSTSDNDGTLLARKVVHTLAVPVQMAPGDDIDVTAFASPAGDGAIGQTSIRIYPIGPVLP